MKQQGQKSHYVQIIEIKLLYVLFSDYQLSLYGHIIQEL